MCIHSLNCLTFEWMSYLAKNYHFRQGVEAHSLIPVLGSTGRHTSELREHREHSLRSRVLKWPGYIERRGSGGGSKLISKKLGFLFFFFF